ncbi:MAG: response regulator [Tissierellales bacterium]|nr:response regulator [Tissierellales bacterium]
MRDYILFLFRNETDESIIEKLSKLNVESVFVDSNISKFISLFDPLALIVDDFTLFSKEKIKTNLPKIYISNEENLCDDVEKNDFFILKKDNIYEIVNLVKLLKQTKANIYSFKENIYKKEIGESFLSGFLQIKSANIKNKYLMITKFISKKDYADSKTIINQIYESIIKMMYIYDYTTKALFNYRVDIDSFASFYINLDLNNFTKNLKEVISRFNSENKSTENIELKFKIIKINGETLPVAHYNFEEEEILNNDIIIELNNSYNRRIILIDEDKIIRSILKARYLNKGYDVLEFDDLAEALKVLDKDSYGVIITEFYTKNMNADDFLLRLKELELNIPVIILSSQKNESSVNRLLKLGAVDYIYKPFSPIELDARLEKLLE